MSVDNRKQKGFVPQYGPGAYKGFGQESSRSVQKAGSKEAPTGGNSGGFAKQPSMEGGGGRRRGYDDD